MFISKQKKLFETKEKPTSANSFLNAAKQTASITTSGNGAIKFSTTQNYFVDQFTNAGAYKKPRTFQEVSNDMATSWGLDPFETIRLTLYLRLITRDVVYNDEKLGVHKGAGLKNEAILRMLWIGVNHKNQFINNIGLFISAGSWCDIFRMLQLDLVYNGWDNKVLDWNFLGNVIIAGLENPQTSELVKKYLPQLKAKSKCTTVESQADTLIAKFICNKLFGNKQNGGIYKRYRQLKSSGTAHQWQQLISQGKHNLINFDTIHGRALSLLVSSDYIKNQGLTDKYQKWIESRPIAKYTGYVHELAANIKYTNKKYQNDTINSQFNQLLEVAGKTNSDLIVVKDTSTSMDSPAFGVNMSSYNVAKAMSIYLARLLNGAFKNHYIDFSSNAILRELKGSNFVEHWNTEVRMASANTNFLSVAELFVSIRGQAHENDFPKGIVCISDGEFDRVSMFHTTNLMAFKTILLNGGFSKEFVNNFKIVFWDIRNSFYGSKYSNAKFESKSIEPNVFYFGGYDPSVITFLTGEQGKSQQTPKNAEELFQNAMNQPLLNMVKI